MLRARTPECRARAPSTQAGGSSHLAPPSLVWKAPSHEGRRCRAAGWHRPVAQVREAGGRGGGEPSRASFRANLGRREQCPMHPSPASPPSCHLGLESHRAAPAWTSQSCGAGRGPGTLGFKEGLRRKPRKQSPLCLLFPDLNWGTSGAPKRTASTRQASGGGAPVGATLSPTPVPRLLCRWDLRLDSQRQKGSPGAHSNRRDRRPHWLGPGGPGGTR